MTTFKMTAYIHCKPAESYQKEHVIDGFVYSVWGQKDLAYIGMTFVSEVEFEVPIPDNFDPRSETVRLLEAKKKELMAEFQAKLNSINDQITRYTAIEFVEAA